MIYCCHFLHSVSIFVILQNSRSEKRATHNPSEERRHVYFLEEDAIAILPTVAGRIQQLTRMPKRTDIHEWLATNSKKHNTVTKCLFIV